MTTLKLRFELNTWVTRSKPWSISGLEIQGDGSLLTYLTKLLSLDLMQLDNVPEPPGHSKGFEPRYWRLEIEILRNAVGTVINIYADGGRVWWFRVSALFIDNGRYAVVADGDYYIAVDVTRYAVRELFKYLADVVAEVSIIRSESEKIVRGEAAIPSYNARVATIHAEWLGISIPAICRHIQIDP